jgi:hypothetical protein
MLFVFNFSYIVFDDDDDDDDDYYYYFKNFILKMKYNFVCLYSFMKINVDQIRRCEY